MEFKVIYPRIIQGLYHVLIESDWNLKSVASIPQMRHDSVLIESDWNLKEDKQGHQRADRQRTNRIRLEFKGNGRFDYLFNDVVLIESDWNLKQKEYRKD